MATLYVQRVFIGICIVIFIKFNLTLGQCNLDTRQLDVGLPGDTAGTLTSPNYPNNYPSSSSCRWVLTAPSDEHAIKLSLITIDIEYSSSCVYDSLDLRDGSSSSSPRLEDPLCGNDDGLHLHHTVWSSGRNVHIYFHSDTSTEGQGFEIQYWSYSLSSPPSDFPVPNDSINSDVRPTGANDGRYTTSDSGGSTDDYDDTEEGSDYTYAAIIGIVGALFVAIKYGRHRFCMELKAMFGECYYAALQLIGSCVECALSCKCPANENHACGRCIHACNCMRLVRAFRGIHSRGGGVPRVAENDTHDSSELDNTQAPVVIQPEARRTEEPPSPPEPGEVDRLFRPTAPPDPEAPPPTYDEITRDDRAAPTDESSVGIQIDNDLPSFPPPSYDDVTMPTPL